MPLTDGAIDRAAAPDPQVLDRDLAEESGDPLTTCPEYSEYSCEYLTTCPEYSEYSYEYLTPPVPISRNNRSRKQWSQIERWLAGEKFEQPPLLKGSLNDVKRCSLTALSLSACDAVAYRDQQNAVKSIWETTKLAKCAVNGFSSLSFVSQANLSSADKKKLLQQICVQQNLIPK